MGSFGLVHHQEARRGLAPAYKRCAGMAAIGMLDLLGHVLVNPCVVCFKSRCSLICLADFFDQPSSAQFVVLGTGSCVALPVDLVAF